MSIKILPHVTYSNPLNVTISSIHNGFDDTANFTQKGKLSAFASSVMVGMKDKTVLHSDNGEYIWSPWLIDPNVAEVIFTNYITVGLRPNCTLLKQSQVNVTYNANTSVIEFDLAPSLYNTSEVDLSVRTFAEVAATARPSDDDIETCVPIQCWMYDSIPGIYTGYDSKRDGLATTTVISYGWRDMTRDLIEYKTAQAIGYIISPNLLGVADNMTAFNITHDYMLETSRGYIFGGVAIQLFLILVVVVMYTASVSDSNRYHADDLDCLVGLIKKEAPNELYDLKTEINEEEQDPLYSTTI
ncbi:hypothetical protein BGZ79_009996 [Entomortierella chlamydospora]|nr:hypothetical protein BGZ79_009996 [Entomortierella chlamydospora]